MIWFIASWFVSGIVGMYLIHAIFKVQDIERDPAEILFAMGGIVTLLGAILFAINVATGRTKFAV